MLYPEPLQAELKEIGEDFMKQGVRVFIFGSCAENWPEVSTSADLDIGYEFIDPSCVTLEEQKRLHEQLFVRLSELPSVRPFDLLNFDTVDSNFKHIASRHIYEIAA